MALYGHEIHAAITPFEAGLAWIVKLDKGEFVGRAALARQKEHGVSRKLIGFEMTGRGIGRDNYEVFLDGAPGGLGYQRRPSPTLNKNIGMCYLPAGRSRPGERIRDCNPQSTGGSHHGSRAILQTDQIKMYPEDLHYTKQHEWVRVSEGVGMVGITDYAQNELGDIVYVDLPRDRGPALHRAKSWGRWNP